MLLGAPSVWAQSSKSAEVFVGYSNLQAEGIPDRNNPGVVFDDDFFDRRKGIHGFNAAVTGYFGSYLGLTGDFSFNQTTDENDFTGGRDALETRVVYFMAGPTLKANNTNRFQPFARVLAGGAHTRFEASTERTVSGGTSRTSFDVSSTDFAMAVGGGLDVRLSDRVSLRVIQIDYAPVFLRDRSISVLGQAGAVQTFTLEGQRQDNIRFSFGIVF